MTENTRAATASTRRGATAVALALSLMGAPVQAMEEITVDGARDAAEARAQDARFRSEMEDFGRAVGIRFKADLEYELKQAVSPPLRLASASGGQRG